LEGRTICGLELNAADHQSCSMDETDRYQLDESLSSPFDPLYCLLPLWKTSHAHVSHRPSHVVGRYELRLVSESCSPDSGGSLGFVVYPSAQFEITDESLTVLVHLVPT
jgi:hypothetical protein